MDSRISAAVTVAALFLAGCAPALYVPDDDDVSPNASKEELLAGRTLYVQRCGSCHMLRLPERHTRAEWERHLTVMAPRAKLTPEEETLVSRFLAAGVERTARK
jgi:hypothetical protein